MALSFLFGGLRVSKGSAIEGEKIKYHNFNSLEACRGSTAGVLLQWSCGGMAICQELDCPTVPVGFVYRLWYWDMTGQASGSLGENPVRQQPGITSFAR